MSDDEEVMHSSEEEDERPSGPSEAELAAQRKKALDKLQSVKGLDEHDQEMLAANQVEREQLAKEISEMKSRSERRKKEREEEERRLAEQRVAEDARRKQEEEEKARKRRERLAKAGSKKELLVEEDTSSGGAEKKSREQLEAEKKAILAQRIQPLDIDGADMSKLTEKAKELQSMVMRLESEKYDLEKRFKEQQYDMMELAERARQMNKVGRGGQIKRLQLEDDQIQQKFAGCPSKIVMYSEYERQKDPRGYRDRRTLFVGPVYGFAPERIAPTKQIKWNPDSGLPEYVGLDGKPIVDDEEE